MTRRPHAVTGEHLRKERLAKRYTIADFARHVRETAPEHMKGDLPALDDLERTLLGHEAGEHHPGPRYRMLWSVALDIPEDQLFPAPVSRVETVTLTHPESPTDQDDDVERRRLLQLAALSVGALGVAGEPVRQLLGHSLDSEPRDVADWHLTCSDHLHALRTRPPAQVRDGLIVDLLAVERQMRTATKSELAELRRVVAMMSMIQGNALTRLGDHGAAVHWWRTARSAADASGDLDLRLAVRCEEAGVGLYGQRDPQTVLALLARARTLVSADRLFWLGDLKGTEAKALALVGRSQEAVDALNTFVHLAGTENPRDPIPALWKPDQVHFAESWVYAHAGDEARADEARDRVLHYNGDYQYLANVRLHEARAAVANGGYETGAQQAVEVLSTLPPRQHSHMIIETARNVLRAVPPDHRRQSAVRDLAHLTTS
jgi:hypothetical protein